MDVTIITGGSRGIGRAAALACAKAGQGVILTFNSHPSGADEVVAAIESAGGKAVALKLDVADVASHAAFVAQVRAALEAKWTRDHFDNLVNNAGFGAFQPFVDVTEAEFDAMLGVHLKGPFFLTQALLPLMADGGGIVNLTSAVTRVATAGVAPYATFKGGLEVLTRFLALELGERRIRANAVSPGPVRTNLADGLLDKHPEFARQLAAQTALGRVGEAEDIGRVIAMLLSADSSWINAQTIEVAGGYLI